MDYCRVTYDFNRINTTGPKGDSGRLHELIKHDEKYPVMVPKNGRYFTFRILDTHNDEVTERMLDRAVKYAWKSWTLRINIEVRQAKKHEDPDFTILFRTPQNDERKVMTAGTIMYHYMPISRLDHPLRGLCVINPDFYYTSHGNRIPLHVMDPDNYSTDSVGQGKTIDIDGVLRHEFGHGLGLSHDPASDNTMSTPYNHLREYLSERDIYRAQQKYGYKPTKVRRLVRKLKWLWYRSDNY